MSLRHKSNQPQSQPNRRVWLERKRQKLAGYGASSFSPSKSPGGQDRATHSKARGRATRAAPATFQESYMPKNECFHRDITDISEQTRQIGYERHLVFIVDNDQEAYVAPHCTKEDLVNLLMGLEQVCPEAFAAFAAHKMQMLLEQAKADQAHKQ